MKLSGAYLAGYFDADGCINATVTRDRYLFVRASIVGKNTSLLEYLKEMFGGNIYDMPLSKGKDVFMWVLMSKKELLDFLYYIEPYVVLKKERVSLGIRVVESVQEESTRPLNDGIKLLRLVAGLSMCILNQKDKTNPRETKTMSRIRRLIGCTS